MLEDCKLIAETLNVKLEVWSLKGMGTYLAGRLLENIAFLFHYGKCRVQHFWNVTHISASAALILTKF